ncbi:hypothetical protein PBY51_010205 [Eleginops maclovinus]|uniref:Uncharacterized protein n=1 Tax=Eleginops maclovinus TaxID=56733 RepID=A0AAN7XA85_ELEMC|nr:hypothetical protein PBY51_010205 [Eleginops maclovinus]
MMSKNTSWTSRAGDEHKSNGFYLQMCEDVARGADVLPSGGGHHISQRGQRQSAEPRAARMLPSGGEHQSESITAA